MSLFLATGRGPLLVAKYTDQHYLRINLTGKIGQVYALLIPTNLEYFIVDYILQSGLD